MLGNLGEAVIGLLKAELPAVFGGETPPVKLDVSSVAYDTAKASADAEASAPRSDDRRDELAFNTATPAGPYMLTQSPDAGPKRVWLMTPDGDLIALTPQEVRFDPLESRRFTLALRPDRTPDPVNRIQVLYGVTGVFVRFDYVEELTVTINATDAAAADRAEALAVAVLALHRSALVASGSEPLTEGNYGAAISVQTLSLLKGGAPGPAMRQIVLRAEMALKATRALQANEGAPIRRIISPSRPAGRAVDITIDVEA